MAFATAADGTRLFYAESGSGVPVVFVHEYCGDWRSWDDQMRQLARGWRCIAFSARGYPGSQAPEDEARYGQEIATRDVIAVMDAAGVDKAHVVGLSMGGYTALMTAIMFPQRVRACVAAGAGSGALKSSREGFLAEARATAAQMRGTGRLDARAMALGPTRVQFQRKDPIGWQRFVDHLAEHPPHAAASTLLKVQCLRASLYDLEAELAAVAAPTLLLVGDEDEPCLDVNLWMKRVMPSARLAFLPGSGHAINLEEPALFNGLVENFLSQVDRGAWRPRDPRAVTGASASTLGPGHNQA